VFQGGLQAAGLPPQEAAGLPPQGQVPEAVAAGQRVIQTPFGTTTIPTPDPATDPPLVAVPAATVEPAAGPELAQPAQAVVQGLNDPSPVQLDLDNVDIYQAIRIIGETLGLNYVIDPTVEGTVNISTSDSLQRSDLLPILETILKINGASMVRNGNYYEIIPVAGATGAPLEVQIEPDALAPGDAMVVQVVRLRFVSASEISILLTPYLSEGAGIVVHSASNVLLITERRSNLRKIMDVIDIFDAAVFENERVRIIPVENALVSDVVSDMESVFAGYSLSDESGGGVRFVPIERLNSVLVITAVEETFREVERWLGRLDQPVSNTGVRNYVYKVRNSKAIDIQNVVGQLYGGAVGSTSSTAGLAARRTWQ